ncbi:MAG: HAD hydrolase-like protein, partial [Clostridia bacterium]|nr:HAD hydrolase-like protein [Clostridia bacterium]
MYETIIFDLDGTLLDTLDDLWAAVNAALKKYSLPLRTKEEVRSFVGNGIVKLMERSAGKVDKEVFDGVLAEFKKYYGEHCEDNTKPYEGIMPLLEELKKRGIKTAVVSNKADFAVKKLAEGYFQGLLQEAVGE